VIAAWYDRQGPPDEVLQVGELVAAEPGPGEVRVRLTVSGARPRAGPRLASLTGRQR
jgi:NADPH:quinone reductase